VRTRPSMFAVCDACGAYSRRLRACSRCMRVSYCNALCQADAWRWHHSRECRVLAVDTAALESWPPMPFRHAQHSKALANLPALDYDDYLQLIDAFARPGRWRAEQAHTYACPPAVIAVACKMLVEEDNDENEDDARRRRLTPRVRRLVKTAMALFYEMTRHRLNAYSPNEWIDLHALVREATWERHGGDNSRARIDGIKHTSGKSVVDERLEIQGRIDTVQRASSSTLVDIRLSTCSCCTLYSSLSPIFEGRVCLVHEHTSAAARRALPAADLYRIDFMTRENSLNIFNASTLLRYADGEPMLNFSDDDDDDDDDDDKNGNCRCKRGVCANDLTSYLGRTIGLACIRLTLTTGIIDAVALVLRDPQLEVHCTSTLSLTSSCFTAQFPVT